MFNFNATVAVFMIDIRTAVVVITVCLYIKVCVYFCIYYHFIVHILLQINIADILLSYAIDITVFADIVGRDDSIFMGYKYSPRGV